ncbi:MAG TPA: protein kinase [Gemmatimonadaceae bacterium]
MPPERLGTALSDRYRVERELGAGGMATVYLAQDLKHDRKVAIKVLKPELAAVLGADRFVVEIKTTASLQHPHILPLFDSGTADGFLYYVMPFIKGETIREKLNRETQFGVDEAVRIAREVADALDYAHRNGVIHRDIKPENILLHDGRAMVMDFGIALAVSAAAGGRMTETGLSLGTPHYMSPEQATADKDLTARSDIYSLGSVLYEMLAGEPPHTAGSAQAVIMKIIADTPRPVHELRRNVPPNVSSAIARAVEKVPADRFESARAFSDALANPAFTVARTAAHVAPESSRSISPPLFYGVAAVAILALGVAAFAWSRSDAPTPMPTMRFTVEQPDSQRILPALGGRGLAISPDGSELAFLSAKPNLGTVVYRRRLADFAVTEVPGTESVNMPLYGPDGTLAVEQIGRALTIPAQDGRPERKLADEAGQATWGDGGLVVFRRGSSLWRTDSRGTKPVPLTTADSAVGGGHAWPHVLPGGKAVLFNIFREAQNRSDFDVAVVRVADGTIKKLEITGLSPRYVSSGHIIVARSDGTLHAAPFDLASLELRGPAVHVASGVLIKENNAALFDVSRNGVLTYVDGDAAVQPVVIDRTGKESPLPLPPGLYAHPRWSPSGDRVAFARLDGERNDVYVLTRATGQVLRLTRDGNSASPEWNADGTRLGWLYGDAAGASIRWQQADGSGSPVTIPTPGLTPFGFVFSPSGKFLAVVTGSPFAHDIVLVPLDSTAKQRPLTNAAADELQPSISPDGRWLAFTSAETGLAESYVSSIEDPATRVQVTTNGGGEPVWSADGKGLIVRTRQRSVALVNLSLTPRIEVTRSTVLFPERYRRGSPDRFADVNRRTGEYVALARDDTKRERLIVVTGWLNELRERMGSTAKP